MFEKERESNIFAHNDATNQTEGYYFEEGDPDCGLIKPTIPEITFDLGDGNSMDFINYDPELQFFSIDEGTRDFLTEQQGNVALVVNMGQPSIGKTSLFNEILDIRHSTKRFKENSKGLKIWSKPVYLESNRTFVYFVDCEGIDDDRYKEFCWIFSYFFGSFILFSTSGDINDSTWTEFRTLDSLSKRIKLSGSPSAVNLNNFVHFAPKLAWMIKDSFPYDYPEAYDKPDMYTNSNLISLSGDLNIKKLVEDIFPDRNSFVFPIESEDHKETFDFIYSENILMIKDIIFSKTRVKLWNGVPLNSKILMACLSKVVGAFNIRDTLNLDEVFDRILKEEVDEMVTETSQFYNSTLAAQISEEGLVKPFELLEIIRDIREESLHSFVVSREVGVRIGGTNSFLSSLRLQMEETNQQALKKYEETAIEANENFAEKLLTTYNSQIDINEDESSTLSNIIGESISKYEKEAIGFEQAGTALNILTRHLFHSIKRMGKVKDTISSTQEKEKVEGISERRSVIAQQLLEIDGEKKKLESNLTELEPKNEVLFAQVRAMKRQIELLSTKKAEKEKMFVKQIAEISSLESQLEKLDVKSKKRWWMCGNKTGLYCD